MTLNCPVCTFGSREICPECKQRVPVLVDVRTGKRVYSCMKPSCSQLLYVKECGDGVAYGLCDTCKILGPKMRQAIKDQRLKTPN